MSADVILQLLVAFIGIVGAGLLALIGWMAKGVHRMQVDVAVIKTELEHAAPKDILAAVAERPTKDEITQMIAEDGMDRDEWERWRKKLEQRLSKIAAAGSQ